MSLTMVLNALVFTDPARATGLEEGLRAYEYGRYELAYKLLEPLAQAISVPAS